MKVKFMATSAIIAALYIVVTLFFLPLASGKSSSVLQKFSTI